MIKDYPDEWPRRLDFLPPMGLQIAVGEKELEVFYCRTFVSIQVEKRLPRTTPTEYGTIKVNPAFRNIVEYEMGNPNPRNGIYPLTQREILNDITDALGGAVRIVGKIPDVVLKGRCVVERIPKDVEESEKLQGSEYVFYRQTAYGNFIHKARRALGIRNLLNPYHDTRDKLIRHGIIASSIDPVLKKIRSTLKTNWIMTDAVGWRHIGANNVLRLEDALTRRKWWTDIGLATSFQIPVNSGIQGQIYHLWKRKKLVAV